jgi:regulator of cell morphogenesis and NO signaling
MQSERENFLDITILEPTQRHQAIFAKFDELGKGESLLITCDHDPKPVFYQLLGERGNVFMWDYLEKGPERWKIRITIKGSESRGETIGQIAAKDLRKAQVFQKHGLDFCCGGKKTLKEACAEKGLDLVRIEDELKQASSAKDSCSIPNANWEPAVLAEYIVNKHHNYVREHLPNIKEHAKKVMCVHGNRHPELRLIHQLVEKISDDLTSHMRKEEDILFPYIKDLAAAKNNVKELATQCAIRLKSPISRMELEHELVGKNLVEIRALTEDYSAPKDACASYRLLYGMLDEFENDLNVHVHLENNILFPKALELEKQLSM